VRARGAGVCGKMAVIGGRVDDQWITIEVGPDGRGPSTRPASPLFFSTDGKSLLPEARAFRIRVKKDDTIGHVRELRRDLDHLERTVGHRPALLATGEEAQQVVSEKVHDLIDEAWSLVADQTFDLERRELTGRALALAAHLAWPGAAVAAEAVLDDVLKKSQDRPAASATRAALARFRAEEAQDQEQPPTHPTTASPTPTPTLRYFATAEEVGVESRDFGFQVRWPLTWRVLGLSVNAETGVLANLVTGRVLLPDGHADRAGVVLLAQRPAGASERGALARDGARKMFPVAKLKALPAIIPGSRHTQFTERHEGAPRAGEITTVERMRQVFRMAMAVAFPAPGGAALPHRPRRPTDPSGGVRGEGPPLPASAEGAWSARRRRPPIRSGRDRDTRDVAPDRTARAWP
jgi:hypothetical protein